MKTTLHLTAILALLKIAGAHQSSAQPAPAQTPWRTVVQVPQGLPPQAYWVTPTKFRAVSLDHQSIRSQLTAAPEESARVAPALQPVITLAMPDGTDQRFRIVASPVMAPELAVNSPARKRFLREAQASAAIRHEHVVSVYSVGEKPLPYLVMEYIPGQTLLQRLDELGQWLDFHQLGDYHASRTASTS